MSTGSDETDCVHGADPEHCLACKEIAALRAQLRQVETEREEARDWVRRMHAESQTLTCVFCGEAYPPGTPASGSDRLVEHIKTCAKHPLHAAEASLQEATELLKLCHGCAPGMCSGGRICLVGAFLSRTTPPGEGRPTESDLLAALRNPDVPLGGLDAGALRAARDWTERGVNITACAKCLQGEHPYWHPAERPCPVPATASLATTQTGPTCGECGSLLVPRPVGNLTDLRCVNCEGPMSGRLLRDPGPCLHRHVEGNWMCRRMAGHAGPCRWSGDFEETP
jgi:hypothetical protein